MKGFVDLQVNGYAGVDFSAPGLHLSQVRDVVVTLREKGTIAFCPTVVTSGNEVYTDNLPVLAQAHREPDLAPHLLGIHLEGPFLSSRDGARGAHPRQHTALPDIPHYDRLRELAQERIALVTVAPELQGAGALIRHIVRRGATVSLGHHLADRETIATAVQAGARASTHLGNGIPNQLRRHPNPIWDQLDEQHLTTMLITDGHHLPDSFIRVVTRLQGADRLIVVSDSAPIGGLGPGRYFTLGQDVVLEPSGLLWNPVGGHLVGSSCNMLECVNHLAGLGILGPDDLRKVAYENPLALIGRTLDTQLFSHLPELQLVGGRFEFSSSSASSQ